MGKGEPIMLPQKGRGLLLSPCQPSLQGGSRGPLRVPLRHPRWASHSMAACETLAEGSEPFPSTSPVRRVGY